MLTTFAGWIRIWADFAAHFLFTAGILQGPRLSDEPLKEEPGRDDGTHTCTYKSVLSDGDRQCGHYGALTRDTVQWLVRLDI